jgi:hypothetical protein
MATHLPIHYNDKRFPSRYSFVSLLRLPLLVLGAAAPNVSYRGESLSSNAEPAQQAFHQVRMVKAQLR